MARKSEFRSVEFFRKVRDRQAAELEGKSPEQIIAYFSAGSARPTSASTGRRRKRGSASR